ncbi:MAG TPA: tetratricopeptide repeat protein [Pyrinomonadaceae bacterium]|nr:tetratricopeptide repeat protein [Pyrinomonadaceae bacterium]
MSPLTPHTRTRLFTLLSALALVAACLLAGAPASAQGIGAHRKQGLNAGGSSTLEALIVSPTGQLPELNMRVRLVTSDGRVGAGIPNDKGIVIFRDLEAGYYTLYIEAGKDYERAEEVVYIDAAKQLTSVSLFLRLKPEANPALSGVPKPAADLFVRGVAASRKGDDKAAVPLLEEAIARHPPFGLAHGELGLLHLRAGRLDKALEELRAAQKALPDAAEVRLNYGVALTQKKDFPEAEKHLRAGLKRMDKSATGHFYLGLTMLGLKDADGAEREFQQAARLGGAQVGAAHRYLGGIYWQKKDYKRAADALETYLKLTPKAADAEQIKGTIKDLRAKQ